MRFFVASSSPFFFTVASAVEQVLVVDPSGGEVADIKLDIDTKELDVVNPLVAFIILFTFKIFSFSLQQVTSKKQDFFFHRFFRKISFLGGTDYFDAEPNCMELGFPSA